MNLKVENSTELSGECIIPPSKSHSHRAIILASLSEGMSTLSNVLLGADTVATIRACRAFGATIDHDNGKLHVLGTNGEPITPGEIVDVQNSGTTIRFFTSIASLSRGKTILTGDQSIRKRPISPLLDSLNDLGAIARDIEGNGSPPVEIRGVIKGGQTELEGISSQFLSSLLITTPLAQEDSHI